MTADPYRRSLENELAHLRQTRVQLRKTLEWFGRGNRVHDATETARLIDETRMRLKATDYQWNEICYRLGRPGQMLPRKPVNLTLTASDRAVLARQAARDQAARQLTVRKSAEMPSSFKTGADWLRYCRETCR